MAYTKLQAAIRAGGSLRDVQDKTGVSYAFLSEVLAGKKYPSLATMRKLKDGLGWSNSQFLTIFMDLTKKDSARMTDKYGDGKDSKKEDK